MNPAKFLVIGATPVQSEYVTLGLVDAPSYQSVVQVLLREQDGHAFILYWPMGIFIGPSSISVERHLASANLVPEYEMPSKVIRLGGFPKRARFVMEDVTDPYVRAASTQLVYVSGTQEIPWVRFASMVDAFVLRTIRMKLGSV